MVVFGRLISSLLRNTQPDGIIQASIDFHREEKYIVLAGIRTPDRSARGLSLHTDDIMPANLLFVYIGD